MDGDSIAGAGRWLEDSVVTFGSRVSDLVPEFRAYLRIFHRTDDGERWGSVAARNGKRLHAEAQWGRIATAEDTPPRVGAIDAASWKAICRHVTDSQVFSATWIGWGSSQTSAADMELPQRSYHLSRGPLAVAAEPMSGQPASYVWPADHSWIVATGVDFDSTILGGSLDVVSAVQQDPEIEAIPIDRFSSLSIDADRLNEEQSL